MQKLYTERNNLRRSINKTWIINHDVYDFLLNTCDNYLINLSYSFPDKCQDNDNIICGINKLKFYQLLKYRIPDLYSNNYSYSIAPSVPYSIQEANQYALLDYIEYIAQNMKTIIKNDYHSYFKHDHLSFIDNDTDFKKFQNEINNIFEITGLQYILTSQKQINRLTTSDDLLLSAEEKLPSISEDRLRSLIEEAITLYRKPKPEEHHLATEKIWDAFERLKTIYISENIDKKKSVQMLIDNISNNNKDINQIIDDEFKTLTLIGNKFTIRHHELDKIDINDNRFYDYLFNRCLSLIDLVETFLYEDW